MKWGCDNTDTRPLSCTLNISEWVRLSINSWESKENRWQRGWKRGPWNLHTGLLASWGGKCMKRTISTCLKKSHIHKCQRRFDVTEKNFFFTSHKVIFKMMLQVWFNIFLTSDNCEMTFVYLVLILTTPITQKMLETKDLVHLILCAFKKPSVSGSRETILLTFRLQCHSFFLLSKYFIHIGSPVLPSSGSWCDFFF